MSESTVPNTEAGVKGGKGAPAFCVGWFCIPLTRATFFAFFGNPNSPTVNSVPPVRRERGTKFPTAGSAVAKTPPVENYLSSTVTFCIAYDGGHTETPDTTSNSGRLFFYIAAAFAEYERELIRERCEAGKSRARAEGVRFGRPPPQRYGCRPHTTSCRHPQTPYCPRPQDITHNPLSSTQKSLGHCSRCSLTHTG
jgi:hypothetical protein